MMDKIDYAKINAELSGITEAGHIDFLQEILPDLWCDEYAAGLEVCQPNFIDIGTFCVVFDLAISAGECAGERQEDRVIAVYGLSAPPKAKRDAARMRGYLGKTGEVFGEGYDKGHFIAHSAGGDILDSVAWFPQERRLNRGWSEPGSRYRQMETFCADNPGTFMFSRPIYHGRTFWPAFLEFGILRNGALEVEAFDNRRAPP